MGMAKGHGGKVIFSKDAAMANDHQDMREIRLLDSCCKAGGCSVGYKRAAEELGFKIKIVGVDIAPQPNYPFEFVQDDCLKFLARHGRDFTHHHASFPCQEYSRTKSLHNNTHPDLLERGRQLLNLTWRPYVIENVMGAPMKNTIMLDGPMFGLRVLRKRKFESNVLILQPGKGHKKGNLGGKNATRRNLGHYFITSGHQVGTLQEWRNAIGIDWMTKEEIAEAVPPAYTHWIGLQLFQSWAD